MRSGEMIVSGDLKRRIVVRFGLQETDPRIEQAMSLVTFKARMRALCAINDHEAREART